jgi:tRNA nucleotidyltransferase (CCA-adding enzyme)
VRLRLEDAWPPEAVALACTVGELAARHGVAAYLVGGPVRDLLLGRPTLDLDVAVEGDAQALGAAVADRTGGRLTIHERFGTATVQLAGSLHVDLAHTRRETYPEPGALPEVEPAPLADDLHRRDFTIHAMAVRLDTGPPELIDLLGGRLDLQLRFLRGLHSRTFVDDPTRIIRAARYAADFDLQVEPETLAWLRTAVRDGVFEPVTGPRIWGELQRTLESREFVAACELMDQWGVLAALGLPLVARVALLPGLEAALQLFGDYADQSQRGLAALGMLAGDQAAGLGERFGLASEDKRSVATAAAVIADPPAVVYASDAGNSTLHAALRDLPPAAWLALWAAHPGARESLRRFAGLLDTHADLTGDDLQAAGYAPGPAFREALEAALTAKLDQGADRGQQLQVARNVLEQTEQRRRNE